MARLHGLGKISLPHNLGFTEGIHVNGYKIYAISSGFLIAVKLAPVLVRGLFIE